MKPSTRIEEIEEELKKQYAPLGNSGEYTTAQVIRINSRAIIQYLDEQSESQETKSSEENIVGDYYFTVKKAEDGCGYVVTGGLKLPDLSNGGKIITQGKDANDVFSMVADAYLTALDIPAKPQDESKEKKLCPMCIEGGSHRLPTDSIMTGTWICFCPCHQKETKPTINKPLWN